MRSSDLLFEEGTVIVYLVNFSVYAVCTGFPLILGLSLVLIICVTDIFNDWFLMNLLLVDLLFACLLFTFPIN